MSFVGKFCRFTDSTWPTGTGHRSRANLSSVSVNFPGARELGLTKKMNKVTLQDGLLNPSMEIPTGRETLFVVEHSVPRSC